MLALLHSLQVVNLQEEGPEDALRWWSANMRKYRILVCGGDGTAGWVLGTLENLKREPEGNSKQEPYVPPVAIMPLGTGNDLAKILGWGGAFQGGSVVSFLQNVAEARVTLLDRWTVVCRDLAPAKQQGSTVPSTAPQEPRRRERQQLTMNNYFGIGVDAAIALDFHQMRERRPELFFSRMVNKLWYVGKFLGHLLRTCAHIHSKVTIVCDGVALKIPPELEGVVILNIQSFAGGSDLWGAGEDSEDEDGLDDERSQDPQSYTRPNMQDQRLEVVGISSFRLGAAQVGLSSARRLAQASTVKIYNQASLPVQVDGEPFLMDEGGELEISWKGEAFMLARSSEQADTIATDVIDWALQRSLIDVRQRNELMKETARRMQTCRSRTPSFQNLVKY
jgi:diacylglycerol kinase (ATP)